MRTQPTKYSTILSAVLLLAALTACSGDPEPIVEPSPPASSPPDSPTPTASPTTPEQESAKAFIRRWQDEAFAMQLSGDTSSYLAMSTDCDSCANLARSVETIYKGGGSVRLRGKHSVLNLERVGKVQATLIFEYVLRSPRSQVLDADDGVERRFVGGKNRYQVNVSYPSKEWRVTSASRLSS